MSYLEIKNFNKTFSDGFQVLKDINVTVEKGEVLSIIGSSGSGKTTLLRCINFLETTDCGTMVLDGELLIDGNIKNEKESVLREKRLNFGLVFQSFNLFNNMTIAKNIGIGPEKLHRKSSEEVDEIVFRLLMAVGLLDKKDAYPPRYDRYTRRHGLHTTVHFQAHKQDIADYIKEHEIDIRSELDPISLNLYRRYFE